MVVFGGIGCLVYGYVCMGIVVIGYGCVLAPWVCWLLAGMGGCLGGVLGIA